MAEGENIGQKRTSFMKSVSTASDVLYEFSCTSCDQNGFNGEAFFHCRMCNKHFCEECNSMHTRILREHSVLGIEDQLEWEYNDRSLSSIDSGSYQDQKSVERNTSCDDFSTKHAIQGKQKYYIRVKTDYKACHVTGCCFLPDGTLLLADYSNQKLKLLSEEKYVMNAIDLQKQPSSVCYIGDNTVAVSTLNNTIALVYVNKHDMKITNVLTMDHECHSVEFHDGTLYVSDLQRILMYSKDGTKKGVFYSNMSSGIKAVKSFTFSQDGSKVYITNQDRGRLVTLDNQGRILAALSLPEIRGTKGVCVSENENVFVCGYRSNCVVEIDAEGKRKLGTITKADGMEWPLAVCFDRNNALLVVGLWKNDKILVYDLGAGTSL